MVVSMKTLILIILILSVVKISSQILDSNVIYSSQFAVVKDNQILTHFADNNSNKPPHLMYFDGYNWKRINQDSIPTIDLSNSHLSFSQFSKHLYVSGKQGFWEYDGKEWTKHFIDDSLKHKRVFLEIIEFPDTSFIITALSEFVKQTSGNVTVLEKVYHEVLQFKNGAFTTIKSRWTDKNTKVGAFNSFQKMKVQPNGNYSYYTPIETPTQDGVWELVTFNPKHEIVRKDTNPSLTEYGFDNELVEYADYLFDSKGSLWFITSNKDFRQFVGLVEKRPNGDLFFYNDNIGIPKRSNINFSFDIDINDNIYFNHTYRYSQINGTTIAYPSLFVLSNDKTTLKEYKYEEIMDKSIWYNGGDTTQKFIYYSEFILIKLQEEINAILLSSYAPLLQFFPDMETTVDEYIISPIHLYPNPVKFNKSITIESSAFENVVNPLFVSIRDISGRTILEESISTNGNKFQLTTQDLVTGTYFVSVLSNNKTILQTKFIKE